MTQTQRARLSGLHNLQGSHNKHAIQNIPTRICLPRRTLVRFVIQVLYSLIVGFLPNRPDTASRILRTSLTQLQKEIQLIIIARTQKDAKMTTAVGSL